MTILGSCYCKKQFDISPPQDGILVHRRYRRLTNHIKIIVQSNCSKKTFQRICKSGMLISANLFVVFTAQYLRLTTTFVDTRLWKTKHQRKCFQNVSKISISLRILSLNSFNSSRSSCYFYYPSGGFTLFDCNVLVLEIILAGFGLQHSD